MITKFKNLITFVLCGALLQTQFVFAVEMKVPDAKSMPGSGSKVCTTPIVQEFYPLGDSQGKNVLTKREYVRECTTTVTEQGKCIEWKEDRVNRSLTIDDYNAYETENFADSIGSLLSVLGAYDQVMHLWSGWKGYCEIGTKTDFSWAQDPMFWASMAMSFIMSSTSEGGLLENTGAGDAVNSASSSVGTAVDNTVGGAMSSARNTLTETWGSVTESFSNAVKPLTDKVAGWFGKEGASEIAKTAGDKITDEATKQLTKQAMMNAIGRCVIGASMDTLASLYSYAQAGASDDECDPVDEVCEDLTGNHTGSDYSQNEPLTMDKVKFDEMVDSFAKENKNLYDYVEVINEEDGIVTVRLKDMSQMKEIPTDMEELEKMKEDMRKTKLQIGLALNAASFVGCLGTKEPTGAMSQAGEGSGDRADVRKLGSMAIDYASKFLGPWGPVVAVVAKLILYTVTSFESIDSCHDEDDAKEAGKRHEKTQKALKFNLCHFVKEECVDNNFLAALFSGGGCTLTGYWYCCYDQILTRILVVQLKAQLGRDYTHCTGITLRDLNYVSLRQCSVAEMKTGIDGAAEGSNHNPKNSYQYKNKCVDMREFIEYLQATIGTDISMGDFEMFWNDLSFQGMDAGIINPGAGGSF